MNLKYSQFQREIKIVKLIISTQGSLVNLFAFCCRILKCFFSLLVWMRARQIGEAECFLNIQNKLQSNFSLSGMGARDFTGNNSKLDILSGWCNFFRVGVVPLNQSFTFFIPVFGGARKGNLVVE